MADTTTDILREAKIHWEGDVARGRGSIATQSGKVSADYSFGTRFSGEPGTNPEELIAAAHAACFTMALAAGLTRKGHAATTIDSRARVHLRKTDGGYEIPAIDLETTAVVPGISNEEFQAAADAAKSTCPVSVALRAVPMTLKATLSS